MYAFADSKRQKSEHDQLTSTKSVRRNPFLKTSTVSRPKAVDSPDYSDREPPRDTNALNSQNVDPSSHPDDCSDTSLLPSTGMSDRQGTEPACFSTNSSSEVTIGGPRDNIDSSNTELTQDRGREQAHYTSTPKERDVLMPFTSGEHSTSETTLGEPRDDDPDSRVFQTEDDEYSLPEPTASSPIKNRSWCFGRDKKSPVMVLPYSLTHSRILSKLAPIL
jgi:hypothetical protein